MQNIKDQTFALRIMLDISWIEISQVNICINYGSFVIVAKIQPELVWGESDEK